MRAANLNSGGNRLEQTMRSLRLQWEIVEESWKDEVSRTFEEEHIIPLERQVTSTVRIIEKLADIFAKIERDCE